MERDKNGARNEGIGRREVVGTLLGLGALGMAGCAVEAPAVLGEVAQALSGPEPIFMVATHADMAVLPVLQQQDAHSICYLAEPGLEGFWKFTVGNLSSEVSIDMDHGIYLAAASVPASTGAWVRVVPDAMWRTDWFSVPKAQSDIDTADAAPALNRMMNLFNLVSSTAEGIAYGASMYNLYGELPVAAKAMRHVGVRGNQPTVLNKRYDPAHPHQGILAFADFGGHVSDMILTANAGSGGCGVSSVLTQPSPAAGRLSLERVHITGGDHFDFSVLLDGSANTTRQGPGNRGITMIACELFGARLGALHANSVQHLLCAPIFIATSGGSSLTAVDINGSPEAPSDDFQLKGVVSGVIQLRQLSNSRLETPIYSDVINDETVTTTVIAGPYLAGVLSHGWTENSFYDIGRSYLDRAEVYMDPVPPQHTQPTGDGTPVQVFFNKSGATDLDINAPSSYSLDSGYYVATRSGYHSVNVQICACGLVAGTHDRLNLSVQQWTADLHEVIVGRRSNAGYPTIFTGQFATIGIATEIYMDAGQMLSVSFWVSGASQAQVQVFASSDRYSRMEVRLS